MYEIPSLLFADDKGVIYDHPSLKMTVRSEHFETIPYELEMEPVPSGTKLEYLPETSPIAYNQESAGIEVFKSGHTVFIQPPEGFIRLYLPAYTKLSQKNLEEKIYTPVGWMKDQFVSPITQIDRMPYDGASGTGKKLHGFLKSYKKNNAFKDFLTANSNLYHTKNEELNLPITKETANFDIDEVSSIIEHYINISDKPILNIQCSYYEDSDPVNIQKIVEKIKTISDKVTVIYSTKLQDMEKLKNFIDAGVDCINVEIITTNSQTGEILQDNISVEKIYKSLQAVHKKSILKNMSLYTLPGLTDRESETQSLIDFLKTFSIDLILLKNLPCDPDTIFKSKKLKNEDIKGIKNMLKLIKKSFKNTAMGYFNRHKDHFLIDNGLPDFKRRKL